MTHLGDSEKSSWIETVFGVLMILVALGVLIAIGVYSYKLSRSSGLTVDLCPVEGPVAHLAILLDTTDPLTRTHLQRARQIIEGEIDAAATGTRVSFSTVNPDSGVRQSAFFSICKPPSGREASQFTENPRMIQDRFKAEFLDPVETALSSLLTIPEAASSPIMEGIQEFASRIPEFTTTDSPRELVIMSDLMQHSTSFSFYRGENWKSFADADGTARFGFAFSNASIKILWIPRVVEKTAVVDDFWVRYLMMQGFDSTEVITIGDL